MEKDKRETQETAVTPAERDNLRNQQKATEAVVLSTKRQSRRINRKPARRASRTPQPVSY